MVKKVTTLIFFIVLAASVYAQPSNKYHLLIAPGTLSDNAVTVLWDKQEAKGKVVYAEPPTFENFLFKNIDLSAASVKEPVININGFKDPAHKLRNVTFENIIMPANAKVVINDAEKIKFENVKTVSGSKPAYIINNSTDINY